MASSWFISFWLSLMSPFNYVAYRVHPIVYRLLQKKKQHTVYQRMSVSSDSHVNEIDVHNPVKWHHPKRYLNQPFCKLSSGCECECFSGQRFCGKYAPLIVTDSFCVICFATTHFWKDYIVSVYDYHGPSDWFILIISNDRKHLHHFHLFLDSKGCWGTTDDFTTSFLHFSLFSTALWDLANSRSVQSPMLSSHLFSCLPCLLHPFTVPCKMDLARPDERETCL